MLKVIKTPFLKYVKHCRRILFALLMSAQLVCFTAYDIYAADDALIKSEVLSAATKWKDAIISKDVSVLVSYALPEAKEYVRNALEDTESELYGLFFGTFREFLKSSKHLKIYIRQHEKLKCFGNGTSVYYYDEEKINEDKIRATIADIYEGQRLLDEGYVLLFFFFKTEGRWYTSFEFGEEDYLI